MKPVKTVKTFKLEGARLELRFYEDRPPLATLSTDLGAIDLPAETIERAAAVVQQEQLAAGDAWYYVCPAHGRHTVLPCPACKAKEAAAEGARLFTEAVAGVGGSYAAAAAHSTR